MGGGGAMLWTQAFPHHTHDIDAKCAHVEGRKKITVYNEFVLYCTSRDELVNLSFFK